MGTRPTTAGSAADAGDECFIARIRYKAKGLDPSAKYHEPSKTQLERGVLARPFAAARGVLPTYDTKKRKREGSAV